MLVYTFLIFNNKNQGFFGKWAFFNQKLPLFRRKWNKGFFLKIFQENQKQLSIFLKKTEKKYRLQVCQKVC